MAAVTHAGGVPERADGDAEPGAAEEVPGPAAADDDDDALGPPGGAHALDTPFHEMDLLPLNRRMFVVCTVHLVVELCLVGMWSVSPWRRLLPQAFTEYPPPPLGLQHRRLLSQLQAGQPYSSVPAALACLGSLLHLLAHTVRDAHCFIAWKYVM
eukprot:gene2510-3256_t